MSPKTNKQIQKCLSQHDDSVRQVLFLPPKYSIKGAILLYLPTLPGQLKAEWKKYKLNHILNIVTFLLRSLSLT